MGVCGNYTNCPNERSKKKIINEKVSSKFYYDSHTTITDIESVLDYWKAFLPKILAGIIFKQITSYPNSAYKLEHYFKKEIVENTPLFERVERKGQIYNELNTIISQYENQIFRPPQFVYDMFRGEPSFTIVFPPMFLGAVSVFFYLREVEKLNFCFDYNYPHALQIVANLESNYFRQVPDALVLGNAPSTALYRGALKRNYVTYTFSALMPPCEQNIIFPGVGYNKRHKITAINLIIPQRGDIPSTPLIQIENLSSVEKSFINRARTIKSDPNTAKEYLLNNSDYYPVTWEPITTYLRLAGLGTPVTLQKSAERFDTFLYLKDDVDDFRKSAISHILTYTLHSFQLNPKEKIDTILPQMLMDNTFIEALAMATGIDETDIPHLKKILNDFTDNEKMIV